MPDKEKMARDPEIIKTGVPYQGDGSNKNEIAAAQVLPGKKDGVITPTTTDQEFEAEMQAAMLKGDDKGLNAKQRLLQEAMETVANRGEAYDGAEDNFIRIARYWSNHLLNAYNMDFEFSPTDVALMMALMKIARLDFNPTHHDSYVDVAGYAACGADIAEKRCGP